MSLTAKMLEEIDEVIMRHKDSVETVGALIEVKRIVKTHEIHRKSKKITVKSTLKDKALEYITQIQNTKRRVTVLNLAKHFHIPMDEAKGYLATSK